MGGHLSATPLFVLVQGGERDAQLLDCVCGKLDAAILRGHWVVFLARVKFASLHVSLSPIPRAAIYVWCGMIVVFLDVPTKQSRMAQMCQSLKRLSRYRRT
ncbi:unnamed protein product [Ectocarpus sp. 12 AP-2014]